MSPRPFRVQPVLDDGNRFFWTSGEDGRLRFLRCGACGYWLHLPVPRCPQCGSRDVAPEAVSGRGEVFSYTVNHQSWTAATSPTPSCSSPCPSTGLRLTSNLVNCPVDDARIGLGVRVVFEQHDQVWFPLFEPA